MDHHPETTELDIEIEVEEAAQAATSTRDGEPEETLARLLNEKRQNESSRRINGIVIGRLEKAAGSGEEHASISYEGSPGGASLRARSTVSLRCSDEGRAVALAFEDGDPMRPIVLGLMAHPDQVGEDRESKSGAVPLSIERDGERLVLTAEKEIVLRCGKASLTLTRAGKVLIRGAYLLSRSSGVNRIKGGSVQIN